MQIDIDLQSELSFLSGAGVPVEQGKISEGNAYPAVYYSRRPSNQELYLSGKPCLSDTNFTIEVYGEDIDAVETLADKLRTALHGFKGWMGSTFVKGSFCEDSEEDYQSKVEMNTDEGINVSMFNLQILH